MQHMELTRHWQAGTWLMLVMVMAGFCWRWEAASRSGASLPASAAAAVRRLRTNAKAAAPRAAATAGAHRSQVSIAHDLGGSCTIDDDRCMPSAAASQLMRKALHGLGISR